jgi:hypothetical protein
MNLREQVGKSLATLLLLVVFMLPMSIQFLHTLEGHEHVTCSEQKTHIHESINKCEVCSFHFTSLNFSVLEYSDTVIHKNIHKSENNYISLRFHSFQLTNKQLRAPPILS